VNPLSTVALFEEDASNPMLPLTLAKPTFRLIYSYRPILTHLRRGLGRVTAFFVPDRFELLLRETEPEVAVNPDLMEGEVLLVNSRLRPEKEVFEAVKQLGVGQFILSDGSVAAARLSNPRAGDLSGSGPQMAQWLRRLGMEALQRDGSLLMGPWELVTGLTKGLAGTGVVYGSHVDVEEPVYFDTAKGPVLLADEVKLEAFSRVAGPALIGKGSVIHSARLNGYCYIGEGCRVGGEVEGSVVQGHSNKAHFGYLGHSYVGEWVNIGAGAVTSDLKNTYGSIRVTVQEGRKDTGLVKLGSFVADLCKVSINASVYAGKGLGMGCHVHGVVAEDVKPFVIYGRSLGWKERELLLDSVLETFRRMKARRNLPVLKGEEVLIRRAYEMTAGASRPQGGRRP
jgi:UDP-N-acetylglucosamine diphosphorylase/glucosamine-1-phosphate N-acetyltransferase